MRRTATLRLLIIDRSVLAKNMYELLFQEIPGFRIEFAESTEGIEERQRRGKPHLILINSNAIPQGDRISFAEEFPTVLMGSADRQDLKAIAREQDKVTFVEKPFYPYDLITIINRVASTYHPLSSATEPAPAPRRRRLRQSKGRDNS